MRRCRIRSHCLRPRDAAATEEKYSADGQKSRLGLTSYICTKCRCLRRRDAAAAGEEHSADEQKSRVRGADEQKNRDNMTCFICI